MMDTIFMLITQLQGQCYATGHNVAKPPANTTHLYNICTMCDQRRRRWADVV